MQKLKMILNEKDIIKEVLDKPCTYKMFLKEGYGRNTQTIILRKKILRLIKEGMFQRVHLSGSRGRGILFIHKNKKYNIIISMEHRDFKYYYCLNFENNNKLIITLKDAYELIDDKWKKIGDIDIFIGNIIKKL
jgi:hypothetical protein